MVLSALQFLHHLYTEERRCNAIKELIRITKPTGKVFITVWAETGYKSSKKVETISGADKLIGWKDKNQRYYHLFEEGELEKLVNGINVSIIKSGYDVGNWWICLEKN